MATELRVDDLLNSLEAGNANKTNKDNKNTRQESNDWDEHEEENNFSLGFGRNQQGASKTKTKKKTQAKGWAEMDAGSAPQQPQVLDFAKIQETEQKKKIFNKPNGQPKQPAVVVDAEYFPSLGEERPKQAPKKPEPTSSSPTLAVEKNSSSGGVRKFVNMKKQGTGENFVPLEAVPQERVVPVPVPVVEKAEPVVQQQKPFSGGFQRSTVERAAEKPVEVPVDTKFKFGGGEGPRKFMGANKVSFKREEEKSEQDLAREAKEKEIEERLAKEKEELAKQRGNNKVTKDVKETKDEVKSEVVVEKIEKVEQPSEEKRIARFSNSKKVQEPVIEKKTEVKLEEAVPEVKASHPVQSVEMNGSVRI